MLFCAGLSCLVFVPFLYVLMSLSFVGLFCFVLLCVVLRCVVVFCFVVGFFCFDVVVLYGIDLFCHV